jgi:Resolvase, N terminal domain
LRPLNADLVFTIGLKRNTPNHGGDDDRSGRVQFEIGGTVFRPHRKIRLTTVCGGMWRPARPGRAGQGNRPPRARRLDQLARSTRDLLNVIEEVSKRGAGFRSLRDTWADTTSPHGRLMLTVLGGLAEFERELIRARTGEGRKRAQERGVRFGRPRQAEKWNVA